jgi:alpha-1,2-mannosyltransferase
MRRFALSLAQRRIPTSLSNALAAQQPRWGVVGLGVVLSVLGACFGGLVGPFDLWTFLHAGQQVLAGRSPYDKATSPLFQAGHAFVYPAFVAWLFSPLSAFSRAAATAIFIALSAAALILACRWLGRPKASTAALVLVSSTTVIGLQMGTVNALLLLGVAAAWRWRSRSPLLAGVIIGVAASMKLFMLPVLIWPLVTRRYTSLATAGATVSVLLLSQPVLGQLPLLQYFSLLSKLQGSEAARSWSLSSFAQSLGLGAHASADLAVLIAGAAAVELWLRRDRLGDAQILGLSVVICILISPIVWSSYLVLLVAPLLLTTTDDYAIAVVALSSWAIVTPDAASPLRTALGVALAVGVTVLATKRLNG